MDPTFTAALTIANTAYDDFASILSDLPEEALTWSPVPGTMNSIAVLVRHSLLAAGIMMQLSSGLRPDVVKYRTEDRPKTFENEPATTAALQELVAARRAELHEIAAGGTPATLAELLEFPPGEYRTGAEVLFRNVGHLREHAAHAGLMRDLWNAQH